MKKDREPEEIVADREHLAHLKAMVPLVASSRQRVMLRAVIARMGGRSRH